MKAIYLALATGLAAGPALAASHASGDAEAGEAAFRQCATCHVVVDDEGNALAGRNAKTGPNLYGLPGRQAGTVEDFRYGDAIVAAGEQGLVWDEESFVAYVQDPQGYVREFLDDGSARSKMAFKVRKEEDAVNLWALIVSLSPEVEMKDEGS